MSDKLLAKKTDLEKLEAAFVLIITNFFNKRCKFTSCSSSDILMSHHWHDTVTDGRDSGGVRNGVSHSLTWSATIKGIISRVNFNRHQLNKFFFFFFSHLFK